MVDNLSSERRSQNMRNIRGSDTKPEMVVRKYLFSRGFRYRLHGKELPGRPDIVLKKYNAVVFVHGCFWHRHKNCKLNYTPKTRRTFWEQKFESNIKRDARNQAELLSMGWRVLIVWECSLTGKRKLRDSKLLEVEERILSDCVFAEVSSG